MVGQVTPKRDRLIFVRLDILIDRLVADALRSLLDLQTPSNLLGRPAGPQPVYDGGAQPGIADQLVLIGAPGLHHRQSLHREIAGDVAQLGIVEIVAP